MSKPAISTLFALHAHYNRWFNEKLAMIAKRSTERELLVQINHVHVMDCLWLTRFGVRNAAITVPRAMDEIRFTSVSQWYRCQRKVDVALETLVGGLREKDMGMRIEFVTMADNQRIARPLWALLAHLFNHQSLHRGEIIAILKRDGQDFGQSDLLPFTPAYED